MNLNEENPKADGTRGDWHALRTKRNHEKLVAAQLDARGYETFLPLYERRDRWRRRQELPLFSGYLFCQLRSPGVPRVPRLGGLLDLVSFGGKPCVVNPAEMDALLALASSSIERRPCPFTTPGSKVMIVKGPLAGVSGLYERTNGSGRLILKVNLLQLAVRAEVDHDCVEPEGLGAGLKIVSGPVAESYESGIRAI